MYEAVTEYFRSFHTLCSSAVILLLLLNVIIGIGQEGAYIAIHVLSGKAINGIIYTAFWVLVIIPGWIADG